MNMKESTKSKHNSKQKEVLFRVLSPKNHFSKKRNSKSQIHHKSDSNRLTINQKHIEDHGKDEEHKDDKILYPPHYTKTNSIV